MNIVNSFSKTDRIADTVDSRTKRREASWRRVTKPALVPGATGHLSGYTREQAAVLLLRWTGAKVNHARLVTDLTVWLSEAPVVKEVAGDVTVYGWFRSPGLRQQGLFNAAGEAIVLYEDASPANSKRPTWKLVTPVLAEGFIQAPPADTEWPTAWCGLNA